MDAIAAAVAVFFFIPATKFIQFDVMCICGNCQCLVFGFVFHYCYYSFHVIVHHNWIESSTLSMFLMRFFFYSNNNSSKKNSRLEWQASDTKCIIDLIEIFWIKIEIKWKMNNINNNNNKLYLIHFPFRIQNDRGQFIYINIFIFISTICTSMMNSKWIKFTW